MMNYINTLLCIPKIDGKLLSIEFLETQFETPYKFISYTSVCDNLFNGKRRTKNTIHNNIAEEPDNNLVHHIASFSAC